ncbi:chain-length determining protein [Brevundimonas sp. DS20]|nr:chain-length determining protein [Brevundimonas sp. DS20]QFU30848.1 Chain length determinant protein [Brevundimonas sp. Bb-A]
MSQSHLRYLGPLQDSILGSNRPAYLKRVPWPFFLVVVLPTLVAAAYFLLIASPRYVSEARFVVRSLDTQRLPSSLGVALQSVGVGPSQTDAFAVHEYITSAESISDLKRTIDLERVMGPPSADFLSRYPRLGESQNSEELQKAFERFVTVGYDSTTGISTLRVQAFNARDAKRLNEALLRGGEALVNRLNERAAVNAVLEATRARDEAQENVSKAQAQLTNFRNRERIVDPARVAAESVQLVGSLMATLAQLEAERAQLASQAPESPQISSIDARIVAYRQQLEVEREKIAGRSSSIAPQIGAYDQLVLQREIADQELAQATANLVSAQQEARRQKLFLERIVSPALPDSPQEPRRLKAILIVFGSAFLAYAVGWLIWAGIREHRQE